MCCCLLFHALECDTFHTLWCNKREKENGGGEQSFSLKWAWYVWNSSCTSNKELTKLMTTKSRMITYHELKLHTAQISHPSHPAMLFYVFFLHFKQHMWYVLYDTAKFIHKVRIPFHIKNILPLYCSLI